MSLRVLVGCKRAIDYAVKVTTNILKIVENFVLKIYSFLYFTKF